MSYRVICEFADAQDNCHVYRVGDQFPRLNMQVSESRIEALASGDNAAHKPLIVSVANETRAVETVKSEVEVERTAEPKAKRQRKQK